ncbi:hypothetical protein [Cerasicoccus maritimus]|uniref:hypothetical protein n=1 Tax=Cerasicoccus maritimus TaxID=490089 RepID=UPI002852D66D|nr:hypothetical protein [Cerasicoccus maritimus]
MKQLLSLIILLGLAPTLFAQSASKITKQGLLSVGDTQWGALYMNEKWRPYSQQQFFKSTSSNATHFEGAFVEKSGAHLFNFTIDYASRRDSYDITCQVKSDKPLTTNMLAYQSALDVKLFSGASVVIDGQAVTLPIEYTGESNLAIKQARTLEVPTTAGALTFRGQFMVQVVDGRKFGGSDFFVRMLFNPSKGDITTSTFTANASFEPHYFKELSLQGAANRTFDDQVAGDGQGGWTDQGPQQDLAAFAAKPEFAGNVPFDVKTNGNGVIVISKDASRAPVASATIDAQNGTIITPYLYLLHASAYTWGTVGEIFVHYADGSTQSILVKNSEDVGNWWNPNKSPNAAVVWSHSNGQANTGIYLSRFDLEDKPLKSITFNSGNDSIWMIAGATVSKSKVALPQPDFFEITAGKDWAPIDTPMTVIPGSALDFSNWTPSPAGNKGPVITTPDGHFAFQSEPNKPVRFFGSNINFSANFLPKNESDALALRMRQMGYNAVRIHHYDVLLAGGWNPDSYTIDESQLDRLDYLFSVMKQQGLYISTDLYTIRRLRNDDLKEFNGNNAATYKALVPISKAAMDDWKRFTRDFLTHKNPYTGLTWAEDPALFSICPVNEDTIWSAIRGDKQVRDLYIADFKNWLKDNPRPAANDSQLNAAFNEYIALKHIEADAEMARFLKEDLKVKALLTGNNWKDYYAQTPIRSEYDYVDNHAYWDHPNFPHGPWNFPYSFSQRSVVQNLADVPRRMFLTRIEGLPFMVTEFNYCYPNQYRGEGGPVFGAYSALQSYDALFRFAWAHDRKFVVAPEPALGMDIAQDPIDLLTEHIIGMFWFRGDMPSFEEEAVLVVNDQLAYGDQGGAARKATAEDSVYKNTTIDASALGKTPPSIKDQYSLLGLTKKISSRYDADANSAQLNTEFQQQQPQSRYESELKDARVILEKTGDFLAETLQSKALVIAKDSLDPSFVKNVTGGPTTVFVGSIDDKPLSESERLLVLHLTNVLSEGMRFGEPGMYSLLDAGTGQKLVKRGSAEITIPNQFGKVQIFAIGLDGKRLAETAFTTNTDGQISFKAETISEGRPPALAYEIVRSAH